MIALAIVGFACSDDDTNSSADPTAATLPTLVFRGDPEPKERVIRNDRSGPATLADATAADAGPNSGVSFIFTPLVPNYDVQYVDEPVACGSGEPLNIEGAAFLQVRFTPAVAHDDLGETTFSLPDDISADLPAILEIQQSCDFENELTFVFGLEQQADFRVNYLTTPIGTLEVIVIDVRNP